MLASHTVPGCLSLTLAALFSLTIPAAAQCSGGVIDTLELPGTATVDRSGGGSRVLIASRNRLNVSPRIDVFEAAAGSVDFVPVGTISSSSWASTWYVNSVSMDGDLIAFQPDKRFALNDELSISEKGPTGWTTSSVALPASNWFQWGQLTAASGDRVVTLTSQSFNRPTRLQVVERDPAGVWTIVDTVETDIRAPWFEYPMDVVLDGDVAALGGVMFATTGRVAVCEPDASGAWSQTASLEAPEPGAWVVEAMALKDGVLAVVRSNYGSVLSMRHALHVYRRNPGGSWSIIDRLALASPSVQYSRWSVALDGERLAVSQADGTTVFARSTAGTLVQERTVDFLGYAIGFDAGRLVGEGNGRVRTVHVPPSPGTTSVCFLAGQETCAGTGTARLRIHDLWSSVTSRRSSAEVTGAPPGATAIVLRSADPGNAPALGGTLCIDRRNAVPVGPPRQVDGAGTASFALASGTDPSLEGFPAADHLQAVVFGPMTELTNSIAWLP